MSDRLYDPRDIKWKDFLPIQGYSSYCMRNERNLEDDVFKKRREALGMYNILLFSVYLSAVSISLEGINKK